MAALSPLFVSHGAPTLPFEDVPARHFLTALGTSLPRPRAILMISAHWETDIPTFNAVAQPRTIHDFAGFPAALYQLHYPASGDLSLAQKIAEHLHAAHLPVAIDSARGLDHGAWVPLMLMWPHADIPVVQLSLQKTGGPHAHLEIGRALAPLAEDHVQIIASGSFTHDLSSWRGQAGMAEPQWVTDFADWMHAALVTGRTEDALAYRQLAPHAVRNHPSEEHLLPLFVAMGAAGAPRPAKRLHSSTTYGVLRMDAYQF